MIKSITGLILSCLVFWGCSGPGSAQDGRGAVNESVRDFELYHNNLYTYFDGSGDKHEISKNHYRFSPVAVRETSSGLDRGKKPLHLYLEHPLMVAFVDTLLFAYRHAEYHAAARNMGTGYFRFDLPEKNNIRLILKMHSPPLLAIDSLIRKMQMGIPAPGD